MSVFICTECGATFDGPLVEASARAFDHSAEHAAQAGVQQTLPLTAAHPPNSHRGLAQPEGLGNDLILEPRTAR